MDKISEARAEAKRENKEIDYITITKEEAFDLYKYTMSNMYGSVFGDYSCQVEEDIEYILEKVNISYFRGQKIKVEGM